MKLTSGRGMGIRSQCIGFTLIELMITVAIIGIVSSITIAYSGNEWRRERVNSVALELAGWLEAVRGASLRETNAATGSGGCSISLAPFTSQPAGTALATVTPAACSAQSPFIISAVSSSVDRYSTASTNGTTISFTPRGSVLTTDGNPVDIKILLDGSSVMRCIRIVPIMGSIRIGRNDAAASINDSCDNFTYGGRF